MGAYQAIGRPLLFALPPETAHRFAGTLLRLPLPWVTIGGAVDHPALEVEVLGIRMRNPVGLAAGFDKSCRFLSGLGRLGFGYVIGGTVTRRPRVGNLRPRIVRRPGERSMVNAMGLPNEGAASAARSLARLRRTAPRMVSLADEAVDDVASNHRLLEPLVDGVELNASCPNVSWGRDRDNEEHLRAVLRALSARRSKPLFVKLPPYRTSREREAVLALATVAREGGADGLTCSNTLPVEEPHLAAGAGGLSGKPLLEGTVRMVREVRQATGGDMPVNACGGVFTARDALACLEAGAATVQVYTGLIYEGPRIVRNITSGLAMAFREGAPPPGGPPHPREARAPRG
jgi:dihydroorotate dehydrogenase